MKLGTLLLRDAVLSLSQLEAALRTQVVSGGKLGTNLVELGFLTLDQLGVYLSRVLDVPLATQEMFDATSPSTLDAVGPGLADVYNAIPLRFEDDERKLLAVAMADPTNQYSIEKLASQCSVDIRPYVTPELRIFYYLEKFYHLPRKARFLRAGTRQAPVSDDRRRAQPAMGLEAPPAVVLTPGGGPPTRDGATQTGKSHPPRIDVARAVQRIDAATSRDSIADVFMDYAVGRASAAVLFVLRDRNAVGWRSYSATHWNAGTKVEELSLPLGAASALQIANDSCEPYRGTPPSAGKPIERRLWDALGVTSDPSELLVFPLVSGNRVVNLLYAHCDRGDHFSPEFVDELADLCKHAASAYERLIQSAQAE